MRLSRSFFAIALLALVLQTSDECNQILELFGAPTDFLSHEDAGVRAAHVTDEQVRLKREARVKAQEAEDDLSQSLIDEAVALDPQASYLRWIQAAIAVANGDSERETDALESVVYLNPGSTLFENTETYLVELSLLRFTQSLQHVGTTPEMLNLERRMCELSGDLSPEEQQRVSYVFVDLPPCE